MSKDIVKVSLDLTKVSYILDENELIIFVEDATLRIPVVPDYIQTKKENFVEKLMTGWGINPDITRARLNRLNAGQLENLFIRLSQVDSYDGTQEILENFNWD